MLLARHAHLVASKSGSDPFGLERCHLERSASAIEESTLKIQGLHKTKVPHPSAARVGNEYDVDGRAELEFTDADGVIHFLFVGSEFIGVA